MFHSNSEFQFSPRWLYLHVLADCMYYAVLDDLLVCSQDSFSSVSHVSDLLINS